MTPPKIRVLLVEDDEVDRMAIIRGLDRAGLDAEIRVATDGVDALALLRGENVPAMERPYVVLLDLNLPRLDGLSVLKEMRSDPKLKRDVVFVLSTSDNDEERRTAYDHLIAGYIVKGKMGRDISGLIDLLTSYWQVVALPMG